MAEDHIQLPGRSQDGPVLEGTDAVNVGVPDARPHGDSYGLAVGHQETHMILVCLGLLNAAEIFGLWGPASWIQVYSALCHLLTLLQPIRS